MVESIKTWFGENRSILFFLGLLCFGVYANSLGNEFVSDDIAAIPQNDQLGQMSFITDRLLACLRPFFYTLIYKLFGATPMFFRLLNIFFHLGNVWLTFALLNLLSKKPLAIFAAVIFAVHPVLVEGVTWITGGAYAQYSFFVLLALLFYVLSSKDSRFYHLSFFTFLLALLSNERAVVFPLFIIIYELAFGSLRENWRRSVPFFLLSGIWGLLLFSRLGQRVGDLQSGYYVEPGIDNPLIKLPIAVTSYLQLIFFPLDLTLYHSEMVFSQFEYLIRLVTFIFFLGAIILSFKRQRFVFFWLSFFIIALLPVLTPFRISWIVAERYVYLGALGIISAVSLVFAKLSESEELKDFVYVVFFLLILGLSTRTILRNADWKNGDSLWLATARTSPSSPNNHNNLGDVYYRRGDFQSALREFNEAIRLQPNYAEAYHNLANTYQGMGDAEAALENYERAVYYRSDLWQSYQNMAAIYFEREQFVLALENMKKALEINPRNANLWVNLGVIHLKEAEDEEAKKAFLEALRWERENQAAKAGLQELMTRGGQN